MLDYCFIVALVAKNLAGKPARLDEKRNTQGEVCDRFLFIRVLRQPLLQAEQNC